MNLRRIALGLAALAVVALCCATAEAGHRSCGSFGGMFSRGSHGGCGSFGGMFSRGSHGSFGGWFARGSHGCCGGCYCCACCADDCGCGCKEHADDCGCGCGCNGDEGHGEMKEGKPESAPEAPAEA